MDPTHPLPSTNVVIRRASPVDYPAYARLFPEMKTRDPACALDGWLATIAPSSWMAARGAEVVGYCYCQEFADSGYVRNVVVAPEVRRTREPLPALRWRADAANR